VALKADAAALPFMDNTFDYVLFNTVICFLKNPDKAFKEAQRVLKPGGVIIIGFIDKNGFLGRLYKKKKSSYYGKAKFYSVKEVKEMLIHYGFGGFKMTRTLSKMPEEIKKPEAPGSKKGGFAVLAAKKRGNI